LLIIEQIQARDPEAVYFLKLVSDTPGFSGFLGNESSVSVVNQLLECYVTALQSVARKEELRSSDELSLELIDSFVDIVSLCPVVHQTLLTSSGHRYGFLAFLEQLVYRRSFLTNNVPASNDDPFDLVKRIRLTKGVVTLYQLFCALFDPQLNFLRMLKESFVEMQSRVALLEFFKNLKCHPLLEGGTGIRIQDNDKLQFARLFQGVRALNSPLPTDAIPIPQLDFTFHSFAEKANFQFISLSEVY
jgi:hypothetical protein